MVEILKSVSSFELLILSETSRSLLKCRLKGSLTEFCLVTLVNPVQVECNRCRQNYIENDDYLILLQSTFLGVNLCDAKTTQLCCDTTEHVLTCCRYADKQYLRNYGLKHFTEPYCHVVPGLLIK